MSKKYHIITYGCQANVADSERIASKLNALGYRIAKDEKDADLIVLNACSVRQSAMNRVYAKINKYKNKKIILAGCLLESDKKKLKNKVSDIWHPDEYFDLPPAGGPKDYSHSKASYVPIMTGCNNFCTYCAVPYTRGRERSRPAKEIIDEVKRLLNKDYKEIWLLGQNVNSYPNFPDLLRRVNKISEDFKIYFMSPHPKDFSDEMIKAIKECEKFSGSINLPVQAGNDEILKKMNRPYTIAHYKKLVRKIRKAIPNIKISTDVIVGFPGETKKQFQDTVKLFKEIKFNKAYISRYSPRPGTPAAKLKDSVPTAEKKRRWQILNEIANAKNKK
ncbi:MiaB/RimO family radical SAM methylthiotransferase [Patescibacteria group bacterium]|nr:MiaB/RimO family radical SAM methylthiotransferase [Patescibacteria group bacterium]